MRFFTKVFKDWLDGSLSPSAQGPSGPSGERELFTPTWWQTLAGRGSDGRQYEIDSDDLKRIRPTFVLDDRAIKNRKLRAEALARRQGEGPIRFINDNPTGDDPIGDWHPPRATLLPPAPRGSTPVLGDDIGDFIVFPAGEGDDQTSR